MRSAGAAGGSRRSAGARLLDAVKRANAPLPAEDSVALRVVTTLAVVAGLAACESVGELSLGTTVVAAVAIALGMVFSYFTRRRPFPLVKVLLALAVCAVFVVFVRHVLAQAEAGNLASVEGPLAVLFVWIQVTHAFDVPARRDLLFSIVASAAFVAVASAQAVDTSFVAIVAVWLLCCVVALALSWQSMAGMANRVPLGTIALCSALAALLATLLVAVLPAPHPSRLITLPNSLLSRLALPNRGGLAGGATGTAPAQPAPPGGALGVGGFQGFADSLDTAIRGDLGNEVVLRVRATRPGYFEALSYAQWNGTSWLNPPMRHALVSLGGGSPYDVAGIQDASGRLGVGIGAPPLALGGRAGSPPSPYGPGVDVQTFYVTQPTANVLVSAPDPLQVWFPAPQLFADLSDGSIRSPIALTPGTVYTVVSSNTQRPPSVLLRDRDPASSFATLDPADLQLPHPYPQVEALARRITAGSPTVYAKIQALEAWMASHVHYSTNIPPLLPGQDAVTQFLFHGRVGYCEQISTALAVMLRTLGIPAREVTGYVPGPFNPLSDLYDVQAKDAHAWTKVYFPGYGWQSFDPTANVPLANPNPGSVIAGDLGRFLRRLPLVPIGAALLVLLVAGLLLRAWHRRPATWAERVAARIERAGASFGIERAASETLEEYLERLLDNEPRQRPVPPAGAGRSAPRTRRPPGAPDGSLFEQLAAGVAVLERAAYGDLEPAPAEREQAEHAAKAVRRLRPPHPARARRAARRARSSGTGRTRAAT